MAKIKPFRAVRPTRDKAYLVPTRPFYSYKKSILKAKIASNPYTFLHVINPEFDKNKKTKPNSVGRFQLVKEKFEEFLSEGIFIQDDSECFYVYRQTTENHIYTGIIAGASIEDYKSDRIKKHEATLTEREETFTNYLSIVTFNAEPVLLFHKNDNELNAIINAKTEERSEYEFSTTQKVKHELWIVDKAEDIREISQRFENLGDLYIADGHHRSASSARYFDLFGEKNTNSAFFLSYLISEDNLTIFDYNRLVKDLNGLTPETFLKALEKDFIVHSDITTIKPENNHEISIYLDGNWYKITPKANSIDESHPVKCLDTHILNELILEPILNLQDIKTDKRIDFIDGTKGTLGIKTKVDSGKYKIGFLLFPITPNQLKDVADAKMIMPPKSTWIEPKLRSGLTIYPLND